MNLAGRRRTRASEAGTTLAAYGLTHAAVDAVCGALLFATINPALGVPAFLAYNAIAFALQPLIGEAVDRLGSGRMATITGACLTAASVAVAWVPGLEWPATACAGLGNAIFHVGGGKVCLSALPGRATAAGIFVAPGAAGLALGFAVGRGGGPLWPLVAAILFLAAILAALPVPSGTARPSTLSSPNYLGIQKAIVLVLTVIVLRSLVGFSLWFPWKSATLYLVLLTSATVLGKAVGGWLADRYGFIRVGAGALLLSAPCLAFGPGLPVVGLLGVALFNMTMPVTLQILADALPGREGFAFGLTCLALFLGTVPAAAQLPALSSGSAIFVIVVLSAGLLTVGLQALPPVSSKPALLAHSLEGST